MLSQLDVQYVPKPLPTSLQVDPPPKDLQSYLWSQVGPGGTVGVAVGPGVTVPDGGVEGDAGGVGPERFVPKMILQALASI